MEGEKKARKEPESMSNLRVILPPIFLSHGGEGKDQDICSLIGVIA